jgi:hypothetical protein
MHGENTCRATVALLLALAAAHCSSSAPTAPGPTPNRMDLMPAAVYTMFISGYLDSVRPCRVDPSRTPLFLSLTQLSVSAEGETWVGRAANAGDGDIDLRIRPVRDEIVFGGRVVAVRVEGTVRGSLQAPGALLSSDRISFGGATETRVEGTLSEGATTIGTITGEIVQTRRDR